MSAPLVTAEFAGRYVAEGPLGSGGQATVYRGTDRQTGRPVAIKLMSEADGQDTAAMARFQREAAILASIRSPHIVQLLAHGIDRGTPFIVLEYIEGQSLSGVLRDGPLTLDQCHRLVSQLLRALDEVHQRGVLHRDIKPSNIMLRTESGRFDAKLIDFGLARPVQTGLGAKVTSTGIVPGTAAFMAPEQLFDERLDQRTDLFAVALVALYALSGSEHARRWQGGAIASVLVEDPPPALPPGVPAGRLATVIQRMGAPAQSGRFPSARAALNALGGQSAASPDVALPTPAETLDGRGPRRTALLVVTSVALGVSVGLLAVTEPSQPIRTPPVRKAPQPTPLATAPPAREADLGLATRDGGDTDVAQLSTKSVGCAATLNVSNEGPWFEGVSLPNTIVPGYDHGSPAPAVILFHDAAQTGVTLYEKSGLASGADERGAIIAMPRAGRYAWDLRTDIPAFLAGWDELLASACIDLTRVYAFGFGHGGPMAEAIACDVQAAAIATVDYRGDSSYACERAVPHIHFEGDKNKWLPSSQWEPCTPPVLFPAFTAQREDYEAVWIERNHCEAAPLPYSVDGAATCRTWSCKRPFASCVVDGGRGFIGSTKRHFARGLRRDCDGPRPTFDTAAHMWRFFDEFP